MKSIRITNEFRELVVADMLAKLDLTPLVDAVDAAALAVRARFEAILAERLGADLDVLVRHDAATPTDSIPVHFPAGKDNHPPARTVYVHLLRPDPNGVRLPPWRRPPGPTVLAPRRWIDGTGWSGSGGIYMPEEVRAALRPDALAYEAAEIALDTARRTHEKTLKYAMERATTLEQAERVWPGSRAVWAAAQKVRQKENETEYAHRERQREACAKIPVGRAV